MEAMDMDRLAYECREVYLETPPADHVLWVE
jgi:hypothetical protein